jgi:hypothetical protein
MMPSRLALMASAVLPFVTASCLTAPPSPPLPNVTSRLGGEWRQGARQIEAEDYTIYYHGTAKRDPASKPRRWAGTIIGDIFLTNPQRHIIIPDGKITIEASGAVRIEGASRTVARN